METINLAPDVDGLILWLRHVYTTDQTTAIRIFLAGWPTAERADAVAVLEGESLTEVLGGSK